MQDLGLRVQGLGFTLNLCSARVSDVGTAFAKSSRIWSGSEASSLGFRVWGLGFRVQGLRLRVSKVWRFPYIRSRFFYGSYNNARVFCGLYWGPPTLGA